MENALIHSQCYISPITIAELYAGVREGSEREILERFVEDFSQAALDERIAKSGGLFRRDYFHSHNVGLADALIAATVDNYGLTLVTLNKKPYPMLQNVHVPHVKEMADPLPKAKKT